MWYPLRISRVVFLYSPEIWNFHFSTSGSYYFTHFLKSCLNFLIFFLFFKSSLLECTIGCFFWPAHDVTLNALTDRIISDLKLPSQKKKKKAWNRVIFFWITPKCGPDVHATPRRRLSLFQSSVIRFPVARGKGGGECFPPVNYVTWQEFQAFCGASWILIIPNWKLTAISTKFFWLKTYFRLETTANPVIHGNCLFCK